MFSQNSCVKKVQIFEPNDRSLTNRDLPNLTQILSIKEGLSPALSPALQIPFQSLYFLITYLHLIHCEIHNFSSYLQKMNWFLPLNLLFAQTIFLFTLIYMPRCMSQFAVLSSWESQLTRRNHGCKNKLRNQEIKNQEERARGKADRNCEKSGKFKIFVSKGNVLMKESKKQMTKDILIFSSLKWLRLGSRWLGKGQC